jgi:hypothetical protein
LIKEHAMSQHLKQLEELEAQLHEANEALAAASQEVDRVSDLNLEERQQLATRFREAQERWEAVTRKISPLIQTPGKVLFEEMLAEDRSR